MSHILMRGQRIPGPTRPLFERDQQLEILRAAYESARNGSGQLLFVAGEAGVGKTTLIREFARTPPAKLVVVGTCDPLETPRPLGPLLDMGPDLSRRVGRPLPDAASRNELFAFLSRALASTSEPLVLAFEDVHWADQATIDLLRYVGRRIDGLRGLVLATVRSDEVMPRSPVAIMLGDLATAEGVKRITVPPLSRNATAEMVADSALDADAVYRRTGGNPFFIAEVLNARTESVPETVRDAVLARAARVSSSAREALEAAAAIGSRLSPALLASILDGSGTPRWAIQEAVAAGFLVWRDHGLAFRHDLARSAIADAADRGRWQQLHALILIELRRGQIDVDSYADLVQHAVAAGNDAVVLELAPVAAERASALSAHREAAELLRKTLERSSQLAPGRRAELHEWQANEYNLSGELDAAIAAHDAAADLRRTAGDLVGQAGNLSRVSYLRFLDGQYAQSEAARVEALGILEGLPPGRELALAYERTARLKFMEPDADAAVEWAERAQVIARRAGDDALELDARLTAAASRLLGGDLEDLAGVEAALLEARKRGLEEISARATLYLGWLPLLHHSYVGVEARLAEGLRYAVEHELGYWELLIASARVRFSLDQARWHEVEDQARRVLERREAVSLARLQALVGWGRLAARRGESDASRVLNEARTTARQHRPAEAVALVWPARAEAAWLAGSREGVIAEAGEAVAERVGARSPWWHGELAFWVWAAGGSPTPAVTPAPPYALSIEGDWRGAARWWSDRGCRYEAAIALLFAPGPEPIHEAVAALDQLGARPAADYGRRRLREFGVHRVPRGPRPSTSRNRAGLTRREQDVLLLVSGGLSNSEIAVRLFLSPKTVERHVSGIFRKLDVSSRVEAVAAASRRGLLVRPRSEGVNSQIEGGTPKSTRVTGS